MIKIVKGVIMSLAKDIASHLLKIEAVYLKPEEPLLGHLGSILNLYR